MIDENRFFFPLSNNVLDFVFLWFFWTKLFLFGICQNIEKYLFFICYSYVYIHQIWSLFKLPSTRYNFKKLLITVCWTFLPHSPNTTGETESGS